MPIAWVLILLSPTVTLPANNLGLRGFKTPPIEPELKLAQTFTMTADGLESIDVSPVSVSRPNGNIRFDLYEVQADGDDSETAIHTQIVAAEDLVRAYPYRFSFPRVPNSKNRGYRFDLAADSESGVTFLGTRGEGYASGHMLANGVVRWADLVFDVRAPIESYWDLLMALRRSHPVRAYLVLGGILLIWLLLRVLLVALSSDSRSSAVRFGELTGQPRVNA
jgi:hypothetical protein